MSQSKSDTTLSADEKFELLLTALTQKREAGISREDLKDILDANAKGVQKALKPENDTHPGISALSYPEGDVARPRPVLPCEFWWNGYPVHMFPETQHYRELELMCQVQPGEYTVLRKDGSKMAVTVKPERDADGKVTKLSVEFPVSREEKWLVPPMAVVLYQLVYPDNPRKRFVEAMREHLTMVVGAEA